MANSRVMKQALAMERGGGGYAPEKLAKYIDHTILRPDATPGDVRKICGEAKQHGFMSVCVNPANIRLVAEELEGSGVLPCCVVGFPLGACTSAVKAYETADAVRGGAKEVDMVINVGAAKAGDWKLVEDDIRAVVEAAGESAIVKVIIETCLLTDGEKADACRAAVAAGAHFVKTSTGFSTGGATEEDVRLMRQTVGPDVGVKASGGVRTYEAAVRMIDAGASRLGTSSGAAILAGC